MARFISEDEQIGIKRDHVNEDENVKNTNP